MAIKSRDIPVELREWWKLFERAAYRHDYSTVFDDFLTMTLTQFGLSDIFKEWHSDAMKRYSPDEKKLFSQMYLEIFHIFNKQISELDQPYYDLFGHMYETISSNWKKSGLGQFFTPLTVVDMMVRMQMSDIQTGQGKRIIDPTSGSGRMLFVFHCLAPGNYCYAVDLDPVCAKMSALNMMLHGCVGEVACANSLIPDKDWRWTLSINNALSVTGIPSIEFLEKEKSWVYGQYVTLEKEAPLKPNIQKPNKSNQLQIF